MLLPISGTIVTQLVRLMIFLLLEVLRGMSLVTTTASKIILHALLLPSADGLKLPIVPGLSMKMVTTQTNMPLLTCDAPGTLKLPITLPIFTAPIMRFGPAANTLSIL